MKHWMAFQGASRFKIEKSRFKIEKSRSPFGCSMLSCPFTKNDAQCNTYDKCEEEAEGNASVEEDIHVCPVVRVKVRVEVRVRVREP